MKAAAMRSLAAPPLTRELEELPLVRAILLALSHVRFVRFVLPQ